MDINDDFEIVIPRPTDSSVKIGGLTLDVGFSSGYVICPVAYRDLISVTVRILYLTYSDVIEASGWGQQGPHGCLPAI